MVSAILFDVDGTLADTEEAHRRAFNTAFRAHGLHWYWSVQLYSELLRITGGKERLRAYLVQLNLEHDEHERITALIPSIHATKTELYTELVSLGGLPLRPGVQRLIDECRAAGVAVGIASTTTLENVEALLTANLGSDAMSRFDVIAAGDVVPRKKPAPDIYELALSRLGVSARTVVAIEDSELGLQSAKSAGLFTIVTPTRWTVLQNFETADVVLPSLGEPDDPESSEPCLQLEHIQALHARAEEYS